MNTTAAQWRIQLLSMIAGDMLDVSMVTTLTALTDITQVSLDIGASQKYF